MNILHINTENSFGGASLCAKRICCAQRKHGIDARMLVAQGQEETFIFKAIPDKKTGGTVTNYLDELNIC